NRLRISWAHCSTTMLCGAQPNAAHTASDGKWCGRTLRSSTGGCLPNSRRPNWSSSIQPSLEHLITLSDDVGVIQHATEDIPNRATGYCTDDVARALIVVYQRLSL